MAGEYGEEQRLPAIPDVRTGTLDATVQAMKEIIEVRQGVRGNKLDKAVTMRDLLNAGLATPGAINDLFPGGNPVVPPLPGGDDSPIPPTPENLTAAGGVTTIILNWDFARGYSRLAYFEVWRSETDALGNAVLLAQVYGTTYADAVGTSATYYYWVRAVSDAGSSNFNAVAGTQGQTAINVEEVLEAIAGEINDSGLLEQLTLKANSAGQLTGYGLASTPAVGGDSTAFAILANRFFIAPPVGSGLPTNPVFVVQATPTSINGVAVPAGTYMQAAYIMNGVITNAKIGSLAVDNAKISSVSVTKLIAGSLSVSAYIESASFSSGATGFRIHGDGNAEFNNAVVRGTIFATAGRIGSSIIDATGIQSTNYTATTGWRINSNGTVTFSSGVFRGDITGSTGTFSGNLHGGQFTTGSFTGYAWPASGVGTYLGPYGLLMGRPADNKYIQLTSDGNIYTPGFKIENGVMTLVAANVVNTLNVAGNAITVPQSGYTGATVSSSGDITAQTITVVSTGAPAVITFGCHVYSTRHETLYMELYRDGLQLFHVGGGGDPTQLQGEGMETGSLVDNPGAGVHTYTLRVGSDGAPVWCSARCITYLEVKR